MTRVKVAPGLLSVVEVVVEVVMTMVYNESIRQQVTNDVTYKYVQLETNPILKSQLTTIHVWSQTVVWEQDDRKEEI